MYDTVGNVWEWVSDSWHDNYKGAPTDGSVWKGGNEVRQVMRSGSWCNNSNVTRAANRHWDNPDNRDGDVGFRVVRRRVVARIF